jgi:hypothetical protein
MQAQTQFLQGINRLTNDDKEAVGFWAIKVDVDLDASDVVHVRSANCRQLSYFTLTSQGLRP